jgi:PPOX class probable F420-dependent enzyme
VHHRSMRDRRFLSDDERAFVAGARSATLATITPDGRPRLVPICFVVGPDGSDGRDRLYSPLDEKPKAGNDPRTLARVRDLMARSAATLLVDRWSEDWTRLGWVRLDARGVVLEADRDATEHASAVMALRDKYPQYASHRLEERPMLRFDIVRVVAWGRLPPD